MYQYQAELVEVIDGDTIVVMIDQGFGTYRMERLRLSGLNCPETTTEDGGRARIYTSLWFSDVPEDRKGRRIFEVHTIKDKREKYGRYLARVVSSDGRCLNEELLERGLAVPYM